MKLLLNLWVLMLLFLGGGTCLVVVHFVSLLEMRRFPLTRMCASARLVYEREGGEGLLSMARSAELAIGIRPFLLDSAGRDLATGENRAELLSQARSAPLLPLSVPRSILVERTASYACVVALPDSLGTRDSHAPRPGLLTAPPVWIFPFLAAFAALWPSTSPSECVGSGRQSLISGPAGWGFASKPNRATHSAAFRGPSIRWRSASNP